MTIVLAGACALEVQPEEAADLEVGKVEAPILLGSDAGGVGAVEIAFSSGNMCTGFLVGTQMVVTVSHCFNPFLPADQNSSLILARVSYAEAGGNTWRCISSPTPRNGKCTQNGLMEMRRLAPKTSAGNDLAVLFPASPTPAFFNVTGADTAWGIWEGTPKSNEPYDLYGNGPVLPDGTGAFTMRKMSDRLNWVGTEHFVTDADFYPRACKGDSGGPYFLAGTRWAFGVHSSVAKLDGKCAEWGTEVRGMRFNEWKMAMVNLWRFSVGRDMCRQHSAQWPHFYVCP